MPDFAGRVLEAPTDAVAAAAARESVAAGASDEVANAALGGLADPRQRSRCLAALAIVADEVSTTSLAASCWLEVGRALGDEGRSHAGETSAADDALSKTRERAFEALARSFAFEPARSEALEVVTSLAQVGNAGEALAANRWLRGLVRDGHILPGDVQRFDEAVVRRLHPEAADDPMLARLERASRGAATADDFAHLASDDVPISRLSFDILAGIRSSLGSLESLSTDQAIFLSNIYESEGESQLAWVVLAKVFERQGDARTAVALMRALESSGDPDGAEYLSGFVDEQKRPADKVRYAIHIAASLYDHGSDEAAEAWVAKAAEVAGAPRAKALFDEHFALGWERDTWLEQGFELPE